MKKTRQQFLLVLGLVGLAAIVGVAYLSFADGQSSAFPTLPNPNGFDDLVKAAESLVVKPSDPQALDKSQLLALVQTNSESLRLIRTGLSKKCSVPTESVITNLLSASSTSNPTIFLNFKSIAQLLVSEGRLAELQGENESAARSYLDVIRLGNEISKGGFFVHRTIGVAIGTIGCSSLVKLCPKLDAESLKAASKSLFAIQANAAGWREIQRNENRFARAQLLGNFNPIAWVSEFWSLLRTAQKLKKRNDVGEAQIRLLSVEMALRAYRLEIHKSPESLRQLVPDYLQSLPLDPFSGTALCYRPSRTNWMLYSVGPDGKDDGGKPIVRIGPSTAPTQNLGDILFDSAW